MSSRKRNTNDWKRKTYESIVLRSWWVWICLLGGYLFYMQGTKKKNEDYYQMQTRLYHLQEQIQCAMQEKEELLLQINSQSDPAWIELVLMKGLGVVPEGQRKVYFKKRRMTLIFFIILLCAFLFLSAFCSGSETALFSLSTMKIKIYKEDQDLRKRLIAHLLSNPNELLVTLMMLNIVMNIMIQNVVANLFGDSASWWTNVGIPLALTLILGEIVPKSIGLANNDAVAYHSAPIVSKAQRLLLPVRRTLNIVSTHVGRVLFFFLKKEKEISVDELQHALKTSTKYGVLNKEEAELASGYLQLQTTSVKSLMRPREEIIFFDIQDPLTSLISLFVDQECTRIPVCRGNLEDVAGIITSRLFFLCHNKIQESEDILPILKKPLFVPESILAHQLMKLFYDKKESFALVVDEYGSVTGLITLEDLVEVVVGEIVDRRDEKKRYTRAGPDVIIASGKLELSELEEIFNVTLKSEHQMLTIGGWLTEQMGDIPKVGTKFVTDDFLFQVLGSDHTRVKRVYIRYMKNQPQRKN